jgi:glycosyltransferase involved in cell wall biosynthesis
VRGIAAESDGGLAVIPVVTPSVGAGFRRLTDREHQALRHHPAGGRAGRRADDFGPFSPLMRRVGDLPVTLRVRATIGALRRRRAELLPAHTELALEPIGRAPLGPGSVFLDLEGSWYDPTPRAELLPRLRGGGVRTAVFVHDVMPVLFPQWFTADHAKVFRDWLTAHLRHDELFLANSHRTAEDLCDVARQLGLPVPEQVHVVPLGADPPTASPRPVAELVGQQRMLLVVGTLEPRKNQRIVLDAFDRLRTAHPDLSLVLVGKEGWMVDDLVRRVRRHPQLGQRLFWLGGLGDDELAWCYQQAFVAVAPSIYEGLGVPVLEALHHGCATIASDGGAQPEAGGDAVELFAPDDLDALVSLVSRHLDDPEHHQRQRAAAAEHRTPTWADATRTVVSAVRELAG